MRIEAYTQVQQVYKAQNTKKNQKTSSMSFPIRFRLAVSERISRLQKRLWQTALISERRLRLR